MLAVGGLESILGKRKSQSITTQAAPGKGRRLSEEGTESGRKRIPGEVVRVEGSGSHEPLIRGSEDQKNGTVEEFTCRRVEVGIEVDRNKSGEDVARLACHSTQIGIKEDSVTSPNRRLAISKRIPGKADPRCEVIAVRLIDSFSTVQEALPTGERRVEAGIAEGHNLSVCPREIGRIQMSELIRGEAECFLDAPVVLLWHGTQFVTQSQIDGQIGEYSPLVLDEEVILGESKSDRGVGNGARRQ